MLDVCIKEIALHLTLLADALWFAQKKKKKHTRDATAAPPHCRQWSNQMLLSCGAPLAVYDGLKFAVRFLVGFCMALCFSVSRNLVLHACTAILRLVHDSDSGRASACTNFGISSALDVSHLSLKKALRALITA